MLFQQHKILRPPDVRSIIEQRYKRQIGLPYLEVAQVNKPGDNVLRNPAHGPSGPGAQQKNQGGVVISLRFKIHGPLASGPSFSRHVALERDALFAQPFVHLFRSCLQGLAPQREPQIGNPHDRLSNSEYRFSQTIICDRPQYQLIVEKLYAERPAYLLNQQFLPAPTVAG